jgi:PAP2 superfamily protein
MLLKLFRDLLIVTFKGIDTGSWKTWLVQSGNQFRLPPPAGYGSPEDQKQLQAVKDIFQHLTDKQKKAIAFWATGPGTKTAPGMWLKFASDAMQESSMRLEKILLLRSVLAMILADTEIAAMDSKYTYWVKRPFMRDNTILTFMPTPNHPSYPSEHAAIAGAGAAFLETFFPQQKERWAALSREATNSRIWSGIHFPMDAEQGLALGREIAEKVLQDVSQTRHAAETR